MSSAEIERIVAKADGAFKPWRLDPGMTHVDTAELYGEGAAEEVVGEAIRRRREGVFLVSKVVPQNALPRNAPGARPRSLPVV